MAAVHPGNGHRSPPPREQAQVQPCRYKTGKTLGAGSYSVVKECVHIDTGRYYAAKVINKRLMAGREHMVRNEIAVLKKVSMGHQNILTLVDYFETMNNLYLVTDLALGGELFDRICRKGSYYESDAADLMRATLSAVAYLHDHGIVHRDLKPENLLFRTPEDNADLLIADFGLSRIMDEEQFHVLTTTCGTPGYMAPEIFRKTGHGKPVDIWAIGVITYFLLCGYTPFDRDSNVEEMQAILDADYKFEPVEYWQGVSDTAKDFINKCLTIDPEKRMTAHQALNHAWIKTEEEMEGVEREPPRREKERGIDLLPTVKKNFNARVKLHAAIDTIRAINQLRAGQMAGMMNGAQSKEPGKGKPGPPVPAIERLVPKEHTQPGGDEMEGVEGTGQLGSGHQHLHPEGGGFGGRDDSGYGTNAESSHSGGGSNEGGGDRMEIDSRGNARGQTEEQIKAQERKIKETMQGLWGRR